MDDNGCERSIVHEQNLHSFRNYTGIMEMTIFTIIQAENEQRMNVNHTHTQTHTNSYNVLL